MVWKMTVAALRSGRNEEDLTFTIVMSNSG